MRILFISTNITNSGGVSKVTSLKANYFADELHHEVHIASTNDTTQKTFYDFSDIIRFHFITSKLNFLKLITFQLKLKKLVKEIKPDLVIVNDNGFKSFLIPFVFSKPKLVYELHASNKHLLDSEAYKNIPFYKSIVKQALKKCDAIVLLNQSQKLDFLPENKQFVIPNPVEVYNGFLKSEPTQRAIAVGRITTLKGYERMLKSWKEIIAKHPNYVLDIFGSTDNSFDIESIIQSLEIQSNVSVHKAVNNIEEHYKNADFLLHASFDECFPMVFLEAMNFGLPIVCYPLNSDLVNPKYCLISENEEEYLNNIFKLIENENLRNNLGENAKKESVKYEINLIMEKWKFFLKKNS